MAATGERFHLNLTNDDDAPQSFNHLPSNPLLVGDIKERDIASSAQPPAPPTIKNQSNGFPAHKERKKRSRFQQQQDKVNLNANSSSVQSRAATSDQASIKNQDAPSNGTAREPLDASIDRENKERLAQMSSEEIEAAKQELMSGLSSSLIERLLKKANIEEDEATSAHPLNEPNSPLPPQSTDPPRSSKRVTFEETPTSPPTTTSTEPIPAPLTFDPEGPPTTPPSTLFPATTSNPPHLTDLPPPTNTAPPPPALDPTSPTFLSSLHSTYYPNLPPNPSTQTFLSPPTPAEKAAYSPLTPSHPPSTLRFDFRGRLLPPLLSSQIPISKGLHHHGLAPEAAGYTIPELAILARSTVPSQQCVAFQTVGRVLYRLGRGDFGEEGEVLWEGLWGEVERGKCVEGMVEAAAREDGGGGNRSVWCTAVEACWLWRKGGGKKRLGR